MQLVTADFETYYSQAYSLTKMPTEQYVRDPRFETIGVSIKVCDAPSVWYPKPEVADALASIDWAQSMMLAQNAAFDGLILAHHYGYHPAGYADTLGMSRALYPHEKSHSLKAQAEREGIGAKGTEVENAIGMRYCDFTPEALARYGAYCDNDVELTHQLFLRYMGKGFPLKELRLIDLTLRMFTDPVLRLDVPALLDHLQAVRAHKAQLLDNIRGVMLQDYMDPVAVQALFTDGADGIKKLLMSNERFAQALRALGVEPPTKRSPTTGKETWAFAKTDEDFQTLTEHENPDVQALVAARLGNKTTLEETRTERFIGMASRGAFPVPLRYFGAHSGRWSGQDSVNLQNLPSRGPSAGKIKKAILAPEGYVVIDCDSAQIEARTLAWLAGQEDLVQAFRDKQDVYKIMASQIYGLPVDQIDKQQRQVGKTVILGAGYGVGHVKLQAFLKTQAGVVVTLDESKRIVDTYRSTYGCISSLWRRAGDAVTALMAGRPMQVDAIGLVRVEPGKGLTLPNGLHIQYPELRYIYNSDGQRELVYTSKGKSTRIYGGKCVENFTQAVARCVIADQMLRVAKRYKVVLTVHDAVAIVAKEEDAAQAQAYLEECMSWNPPWASGLPLACESGVGKSYGDC